MIGPSYPVWLVPVVRFIAHRQSAEWESLPLADPPIVSPSLCASAGLYRSPHSQPMVALCASLSHLSLRRMLGQITSPCLARASVGTSPLTPLKGAIEPKLWRTPGRWIELNGNPGSSKLPALTVSKKKNVCRINTISKARVHVSGTTMILLQSCLLLPVTTTENQIPAIVPNARTSGLHDEEAFRIIVVRQALQRRVEVVW